MTSHTEQEAPNHDLSERKRLADQRWTRHSDGRADAPILVAGMSVIGSPGRRRSAAPDVAGGAADCLPRQQWAHWRVGSSLPTSLRLAVLWPQRGGWHPLRLSRLEIRHRGPLS